MPTPTGHTRAILASKVSGTNVYNNSGEKIGHVEDIVLDKMSNEVKFAILGFGGFLGIGEKFHAVPWSILDYKPESEGYVIGLTREALEGAPTYRLEDLTKEDGKAQADSQSYYSQYN